MMNKKSFKQRLRELAPIAVVTLLTIGSASLSAAQTNTFPTSGNAGVGTTAPGCSLSIGGGVAKGCKLAVENNTPGSGVATMVNITNAVDTDLLLNITQAGAPTKYALIQSSVPGRNLALNGTNGGNVGIGTTSPSDLLQIDSAAGWALKLRYTGDGHYVRFSSNQISAFTSAGVGSELYLNTAGGNVGIGTTSPIAKLHVAGDGKFTGNLTVDGNLAAKYQDVAEWVDSSQALPFGTVVVLDSSKSNQVVASREAYDSRVAGVISLRPGLALGEAGEGRVLVATTGRVKVKVNATDGPIQIGDLLVTSDVEGVAMKSVPLNVGGARIHRPGTIIGKALEPLANGRGEILVLLSLQ
jgi:hypothetical protein